MRIYVDASATKPGNGSHEQPYTTIQQAADVAQPGDTVLVMPGLYRENVHPRHSGTEDARITYRSIEPRKAIISGAEPLTDWTETGTKGVWSVTVPASFFTSTNFNPFSARVGGDWLHDNADWHRAQIFCDARSLFEVRTRAEVDNPTPNVTAFDPSYADHVWYATVNPDTGETRIDANFQDENPNDHDIEVSIRPQCFAPQPTGINYITVDGFTLTMATPQWAPPTAFQDGLIAPHWSKGWIIENCEISHSRCTGISLGRPEMADQENKWLHQRVKDGAQTQRETVIEATYNGWDKQHIGSHLIRHNRIFDCGQAGIVGHMGGAFSTIEDNEIFNCATRRDIHGEEQAGIKLHAAIDTQIIHNNIHHCYRGIWLDWEAQGTRVQANLLHHNCAARTVPNLPDDKLTGILQTSNGEDIFIEVGHGPVLVDENLLLSERAVKICSQGVALVHNLIAGSFPAIGVGTNNGVGIGSARFTPYHVAHGTQIFGFMTILHGDDRIYNNIFVQPANPCPAVARQHEMDKAGLIPHDPHPEWDDGSFVVGTAPFGGYPSRKEWESWFDPNLTDAPRDRYYRHLPVESAGNVFLSGAKSCSLDVNALTSDQAAHVDVVHVDGGWKLQTDVPSVVSGVSAASMADANRSLVTTDLLGKAFEPEEKFENPDGTPITCDRDLLGHKRDGVIHAGPLADYSETGEVLFADLW